MQLVQIPPDAAPKVWPIAAQMLAPAIERSNGYTSASKELSQVVNLQKQLWMVLVDDGGKNKAVAAGITSLQPNEDGTTTANIEYFGGENMNQWFVLKDVFEQWAKDNGCSDIRFWARKAWVKKLKDYDLTHYIMRKVLT